MTLSEIYDDFAATYEKNRGLFDMTKIIDDFVAHLDCDRGRLLDLGCGAGEPFPRWFVDHGWAVTGVDFSIRMLELAARYVPEMETICADMREVDFEPDEFDAITAIYSLFHVSRSDHPMLFEHFRRWLRPGGSVLFTYATEAYTGCERFDGCRTFMGRELYYSHTTPAELYRDLAEAGLVVEAGDEREIGGETFLWVTARCPVGDGCLGTQPED